MSHVTPRPAQRPDLLLFSLLIALVAAGVIAVYSASYPRAADAEQVLAEARTGDPTAGEAGEPGPASPSTGERIDRLVSEQQAVMRRQLTWAWLGLVAMLIGLALPYRWLRSSRFAGLLLGAAVTLLVAVLVAGTDQGRSSRRWLELGPFSFQPSELAKMALVVYLANRLARVRSRIRQPAEFGATMGVIGLVALLVVIEPHLGATLVLGGVALSVLYVGGARTRHLGLVVGLGLVAVTASVLKHDYQGGRFTAWLHPERNEVLGYQAVHCGTGLARGHFVGRGLGRSIEKFYYLPECHTDSILAVIGEETGLLGTTALLLLFVGVAGCGLRIAWRCQDPFGKLLATGLTAILFLQAMLNYGVTTGLLPQTGVGLPFISYGGSSLLCFMAAAGLLLNVSRLCPPVRRGRRSGAAALASPHGSR